MPLTFDIMISSSQASLNQIGPNLNVTLLKWSSSKIVSGDIAYHPQSSPKVLIGWKLEIGKHILQNHFKRKWNERKFE
jgi:hypothetical protein